jgi:serine/threonine protein kinase
MAMARFHQEIGALVRLAHPHVVPILDVGEHEGIPFLVLPYLAGKNLRDRQRRGSTDELSPVPLVELHAWLEPMASVLDFLHRQGHVHRDVKPDNILFDAFGHVYLSDFGLAKAFAPGVAETTSAPSTDTGVLVGTRGYMAPELALGGSYDRSSDQYALAVTVYEMISGRRPSNAAFHATSLETYTASGFLLCMNSNRPFRLLSGRQCARHCPWTQHGATPIVSRLRERSFGHPRRVNCKSRFASPECSIAAGTTTLPERQFGSP